MLTYSNGMLCVQVNILTYNTSPKLCISQKYTIFGNLSGKATWKAFIAFYLLDPFSTLHSDKLLHDVSGCLTACLATRFQQLLL